MDDISRVSLLILGITVLCIIIMSAVGYFLQKKTLAGEREMPVIVKILSFVFFLLIGISLVTMLPDLLIKGFIGIQSNIGNQGAGPVTFIIDHRETIVAYIRYFFWTVIGAGTVTVFAYFAISGKKLFE